MPDIANTSVLNAAILLFRYMKSRQEEKYSSRSQVADKDVGHSKSAGNIRKYKTQFLPISGFGKQ
jgi:hypothetical protein